MTRMGSGSAATVPAERFVVSLARGVKVAAAHVEVTEGGWLRVVALRWRVEFDPDEAVGHQAFDGVETRLYPPHAVEVVREVRP